MNMQRHRIIISILIILIMSLFVMTLFSCKQPEIEVPEEEIFYDNCQYDLTYIEDDFNYRLNLDGNGGITCYRSADDIELEQSVQYSMITDANNINRGLISFTNPFESVYNRIQFYILDDEQNTCVMGVDDNGNSVPTPDNAIVSKRFLPLDKEFEFHSIDTSEGYTQYYTIFFSAKDYTNTGKVRIIKAMDEYLYGDGTYSIQEKRYIELVMNASSVPSSCFYPKDQNKNIVESQNVLASNYNDKGLVRLALSISSFKYVQLYDDGTFDFVYSTFNSPEDAYTADSFAGKTFVQQRTYYNETTGDKYTFDMTLTFTETSVVIFTLDNCVLERHYRIIDDNNIEKINYDIEIYMDLIGTHVQLYSSNNIAFANDFNIYISYDEQNYAFTESDLMIQEYDTYNRIILNKDGKKFVALFYKDGTWEWEK